MSILRTGVRLLPMALLASAIMLAWLCVVWSATNMDHPLIMLMMPMTVSWTWIAAVAVFAMWTTMMAAMMLPAAVPVLSTYHRMAMSNTPGTVHDGVVYFAAGHVLVWIGFAAAATVAQWGLVGSDLIEPMMIELKSTTIGGAVLIAAGIFQWTPLKDACLSRCRSPLGFLLTEWQPGRVGAFVMGVRYGLFCLGCCWALMALLFVFGAMNLLAIIVLALIVVLEKITPHGQWLARAFGAALVLFGAWWIVKS